MNLGDLLGMGGSMPNFGGGNPLDPFGQPGDFSATFPDQPRQPWDERMPEPRAAMPQMPQPKSRGNGLLNVLGVIGDALLVHSGRAPIYGPRMQQRRMGEALGNYLGKLDPGLAEIIAQNPEVGFQLYKMMHPPAPQDLEIVREMRAAGIDPTSEEGRALIKGHLSRGGGAGSSFGRDLEVLGIDPQSDEARELYYGRNSPAGFLLKPPSRGGGSQSLPKVVSQEQYDALPPGTRYQDSRGNVGVKGGATASPSQPF